MKQGNPGSGHEDNVWFTTARSAAAAGTKGWIKITKLIGGGWGYVKVDHEMFEPVWPKKPFEDLLFAAFPEHVVTSLNHDLIQTYKERGA